jgi:hypothetical protein
LGRIEAAIKKHFPRRVCRRVDSRGTLDNIITFNDGPRTTFSDVRKVLREANV